MRKGYLGKAHKEQEPGFYQLFPGQLGFPHGPHRSEHASALGFHSESGSPMEN